MIRRGGGLVALVLILGLLAACDSEAEPEGAFYLEAEVRVTNADDVLASLRDLDDETATGLRWWYRDPEHYRHEYYREDSMWEWGPQFTVADGDDVVFYEPRSGAAQRWSLDDSGFAGLYPGFSAIIGPVPADSVDAFIDEWRGRLDHVERAGTEEMLGRSVTVIEYGTSSQAAGSDPSPELLGRFYVDEEAGFILKNSLDGGVDGQSYVAEVTLLDLAPDFEDARFEPTLPGGAVEDVPSPDGCRSSSSDAPVVPLVDFPPPAGWHFEGSGGSQSASCRQQENHAGYTRGDTDRLVIGQMPVPPTGVPPPRADATPVDIGGLEGYRLTTGDIERLAWVQGDMIVELETNAATFEELLRIAESAR